MKVLWFCNCEFTDSKSPVSGTWLFTMANALIGTGSVQLYNITQGKVKNVTRRDSHLISQWLVPSESIKSNGLPRRKTIIEIQKIVESINPEIIHIWGTEGYWGMLSTQGYIKGNIILEIQGLKFTIAKYFYSGLSFRDILNCFGLREFLKPSVSLLGLKYHFNKWGKLEKRMLKGHKVISTQSDWVRAHVKNVNSQAQLFNTSILLRPEFIVADKWEADHCVPYQIFTSFSSSASYKGIHVLLDTVTMLNSRYPQIRLFIAGSVKSGIREDGYSKWLKKKIIKLGISEYVFWLGSLDAEEIILQLYNANVVVIPSFVESYSVTFDEALTVGVPTVASFAGAMPELAIHEKSALFFPPGDTALCANAIEKFFLDKEYAETISQNAYNDKKEKTYTNIAELQMSIYRSLL
jgi:glycosyltransferase involved in cell wall biosynthesis